MSGIAMHHVMLSDDEVTQLEACIADPKTTKYTQRRCRILLDMDENHGRPLTRQGAAYKYGVVYSTITGILSMFAKEGIQGVMRARQSSDENT